MAAQLHLMINSFPIVGMFFSLLIFIYILFLKGESHDFRRFGILFFFIVCLTSFPVYLTGNFAKSSVGDLPVFSEKFFEIHKSLGLISIVLSAIFGLVSLFFLIRYRSPRLLPFWTLLIVFVFSIVSSVFMGITGSFGGRIMHEEIRDEEAFNPFKGRIYSKGSPYERTFQEGKESGKEDSPSRKDTGN